MLITFLDEDARPSPFKPTRLQEVAGSFPYAGPARTLEEGQDAVSRHAKERVRPRAVLLALIHEPSANKLLDEAIKLPEGARAHLAAALIESLDDERDPNVESAWSDEIARRLRDDESGAAKPIPWSEAREMIFGPRGASTGR